jgi:hypothetical protein
MEMLAVTCQTLYDVDLLDKKNEIVKIKKELNNNILPKILYENYEEWETLKTEAIRICQVETRDVWKYFDPITVVGRDYAQGQSIFGDILLKALKKLSKGFINEWMLNFVLDFENTIVYSILALDGIGALDGLSSDDMITYIRKIFIEFIMCHDPDNGILKIRHFKCSVCNKIDDYIGDNRECWDCSPESDN